MDTESGGMHSELCLSSRQVAELGQVSVPLIDQLLKQGVLDQQSTIRLKVAVQEAVSNALEHGNLRLASAWKEELLSEGEDLFSVVRRARLADPLYGERTVTVRAWVDDGVEGGTLLIEVSDEGEGFLGRWKSAPIQMADPETVQCSGRGLALMANSVDALRFRRNGATVTLVKHLATWAG